MNCPTCGRRSIVKDSRSHDSITKRVRFCNGGHRWTTFERVETDHGPQISAIVRTLRTLATTLETPSHKLGDAA